MRQGILKVQCNIHLLIHLLSTYYVPDISLGAGDTDSSHESSPRIKSCLLRRQPSTQTMTTHCDQCLKTSSSGLQVVGAGRGDDPSSGLEKRGRNRISLTLFLETPILRKVEKANDIIKRHSCKLT